MVEIAHADLLDIGRILQNQKERKFLIALADVGTAEVNSMRKGDIDRIVWAKSQRRLAEAVRLRNLIVARDGDDVVGYALLGKKGGEWELQLMNVIKGREREGIATRLLDEAHRHAKKRGGTKMYVKPDVMAFGFWPKMGYKPDKNPYLVREV